MLDWISGRTALRAQSSPFCLLHTEGVDSFASSQQIVTLQTEPHRCELQECSCGWLDTPALFSFCAESPQNVPPGVFRHLRETFVFQSVGKIRGFRGFWTPKKFE